MELYDCYQLLNIKPSAPDEEVTKAYKRLAHHYHPDKNRDRVEWATRAMANLNIAYTTITGHRFSHPRPELEHGREAGHGPAPGTVRQGARKKERPARRERADEGPPGDVLVGQFVKLRESAKDMLYRYFQYGLYNLVRRENPINRGMFNEVVLHLRKSYHGINKLADLTKDGELLEHFRVFGEMVFNFYKASECLNIPDSYSNLMDVEAFRLFKKGDDALHGAHRELFFDRHNRGSFRRDITEPLLLKAEYHLKEALRSFPDSTWSVETRIKLEYVLSLRTYIALFFTPDG